MRESTLHKLQEEIVRAKHRGFFDEIKEKTERLNEIKRLWELFKENELVLKMKDIVEKYVSHYETDFYYNDLINLEKSERQFMWYVYASGTHFVWLEGTDEEINNSKDWFNAIRTCKSKNNEVDPRHRMFVVDQKHNRFKRIKSYSEVTFRVMEI